jgi:hypothetical protein
MRDDYCSSSSIIDLMVNRCEFDLHQHKVSVLPNYSDSKSRESFY